MKIGKGRPAGFPTASILSHPTPTKSDTFNTGDVAAGRDIKPVSLGANVLFTNVLKNLRSWLSGSIRLNIEAASIARLQ
ncbi:MAG: hypothetical protein K8R59_09715 [Thermoanaerobaculales bacterium]|nr:hypothetical protein [Thermoanaerobaculales bacterium]